MSLHGQQPPPPARPDSDDAGLPLQERRRADQRHGDGVRRQRPLRPRPAPGRLHRLRRRSAGRRHALQRRAGAGQPRASRSTPAAAWPASKIQEARSARSTASSYDLLDRARRDLPLSLQQLRRCCCRAGRAIGSCCRARSAASTPNGGTAMYDAVAEAIPLARSGQNRKKALLVISDGNDTSSRDRRPRAEGSRFARAKCWSTRSASTARRADARPPAAAAAAAAACRSRCRCRFPARRGRRRHAADLAAAARRPAAAAVAAARGGDDRVNVVALRDMTDDSGGRTEIVRDAARSESGDREHRRRAEQAVLPRLPVDRQEGRPLALDPRRAAQSARYRVRARDRGTSARARMSRALCSRPRSA